MRIKKQSTRQMRDEAALQSLEAKQAAKDISKIVQEPLRPIPRFFRGALIKPK